MICTEQTSNQLIRSVFRFTGRWLCVHAQLHPEPKQPHKLMVFKLFFKSSHLTVRSTAREIVEMDTHDLSTLLLLSF